MAGLPSCWLQRSSGPVAGCLRQPSVVFCRTTERYSEPLYGGNENVPCIERLPTAGFRHRSTELGLKSQGVQALLLTLWQPRPALSSARKTRGCPQPYTLSRTRHQPYSEYLGSVEFSCPWFLCKTS